MHVSIHQYSISGLRHKLPTYQENKTAKIAAAESHFLGEFDQMMCPAVQAPPPTCGVNFELMVIFAHSDALFSIIITEKYTSYEKHRLYFIS